MGYRTPLESRVAKQVTRAITDYGMIADGDRVMVGLSGGKDSWALIQILDVLQKRAPIDFSIVAVTVDSGYKDYKHGLITEACKARGWELRIEHTTIGEQMDDILDAGDTPCSLCARLRRGVLYRVADEVGATKIALGHHLDDFVETLLLNVFFAGAGLRDRGRCPCLHAGKRAAGDRLLLSGLRRSQPAAAAHQAAHHGARTRASAGEGLDAEGAHQREAPAPARPPAARRRRGGPARGRGPARGALFPAARPQDALVRTGSQ
jgi:hypothetical protein